LRNVNAPSYDAGDKGGGRNSNDRTALKGHLNPTRRFAWARPAVSLCV
jgi:hypothetical protein